MRATGRKINELIKDFEDKYHVRDKQDALAMCALQYVAKVLAQEKKAQEQEQMQSQALEELTEKINQNL
uniref:cell division protein ZapA n=1 Tax=Ornithobacterium rhinotracheale TaxID=28251 RepID=UPI0021AAB65F|nr:cell division protein ZapA [Ornithobacterium rhinotracheale]